MPIIKEALSTALNLSIALSMARAGVVKDRPKLNPLEKPVATATTDHTVAVIPELLNPEYEAYMNASVPKGGSTGSEIESTPQLQVDEEDGVYTLHTSDGEPVEIDLSGAIGFTPDPDLRISDIQALKIDQIPTVAGDFNTYLNTPINGFGPLAGYIDGTNDYNQYYNHESGPQVPMFSWMVMTGLRFEIPNIGTAEGSEGRAVMALIINRTDKVFRFDTNSVTVEAGFQGWGRIWNGDAAPVQEAEKRLVEHYLTRLGLGVPETGFIGQCDLAENCKEVTVVAVEIVQWGENEDGTPRYIWRLIRAETLDAADSEDSQQ